jgi:regulator of protease activity HflC (stomatin/prohibitin superfamily)
MTRKPIIVDKALSLFKDRSPRIRNVIVISSAAFLFFIIMDSYHLIHPGTVGVVTHFGAVQTEILPEGLHFITPVKTKVVPIDVRIQLVEDQASASSKDLQMVTSRVALNFYLSKTKANIIFQEQGLRYQKTIIAPTIQESVKSTIAKFNAEEVITLRPKVKQMIFEDIRDRLEKNNIIVTDFSIVDFSFSPEFNKAIEEKQIAEQSALRAKNDLVRIRTEAEQVEVRAEGEAKAQIEIAKAEAQAQELLRKTISDQIIQLRAIERWDGVMPLYVGESTGVFLDLVRGMEKKEK